MKNIKNIFENVNIFWLIILIFQQYIDGVILFSAIIFYVIYKNRNLHKLPIIKGINLWIFMLLIAFGLEIGIIHIGNYASRDIIRDIYYYLQPVIYIYAGYIYCKNDQDNISFYKTFCLAGIVVSLIFLLDVAKNPSVLFSTSVIDIRNNVGKEQFIVLFTLVILLTRSVFLKNRNRIIATIIVLSAFVLQFSRTAFGTIVIILITDVILQRKITSRLIKAIALAILGLTMVIIILPNDLILDFINRISKSITEVSTTSSFNNLQEIQSNWRGFEMHLVQKNISGANILEQILGFGFGKTVSLEGYMVNLGGNDFQSISTFHNGYIFVLLKNGYMGLVLYVSFFILLIIKNIKNRTYESRLIVSFTLAILFLTYTKGGILRGSSIIEYCFLIGYETYYIKSQNKDSIYGRT